MMSQSPVRRRPAKDSGSITNDPGAVTSGLSGKETRKSLSSKRLRLIALASAVLALFLLFWRRDKSANIGSRTYIVCSSLGKQIYTVDAENTRVQCMIIEGDHILDTGDLDDLRDRWDTACPLKNSTQIDSWESLDVKYIPKYSIVVPGMTDAHGHTLEYGASRLLPLEGCYDASEAVQKVRHFIEARPKSDAARLVEGWGWDHTAWPVEQFPHFEDLESDPVVRGHLIVLQSKDGHAQWVSKAMLDSMLPLPYEVEGGVIVRDKNGNPTGVFIDKAQDLIKRPPLTDEDRLERFHLAVNDALSMGFTSLHDAGFDPASLAFFKKRSELGKLPIRIYGMTYFNESDEYWGGSRAKILDQNRLTARSVKIFADGALRSGGAALYEPYTDNPDTRGVMRIEPEVLNEFVPKFVRDGWQVNIHAIGDRANAIVIDAIEAALTQAQMSGDEVRPRIEHAQIILPQDAKRMARLGVIASVQPTHVVSDMWYAEDRLGPERIKNLYPYRTIIDAGARVALGSDFPVEDMNPMAGFQAAITRLSSDGRSPHGPQGWHPEQRLTRVEALRGYTIDPAFASFSDDRHGSLESGKHADFVILSQDIMSIHESKIIKTEVLATVLDGEVVFGSL